MHKKPTSPPRHPVGDSPKITDDQRRNLSDLKRRLRHEEFEALLEEKHGRITRVDEQCAAIGRDPASLRRSYLMFDVKARSSGGQINYYASETVFADMAQRVIDLGITDIGLYYPVLDEQLPVFEHIARRVIPELKATHNSGG